MTMPSKGSRNILVDGINYRWRMRKKPTYSQGAFASQMTFAVESIDDKRPTLLVTTNAPRPDNWLGMQSASITPKHISAAIRKAIAEGWNSKVTGAAFKLRFDIFNYQPGAAANGHLGRP